MAAFFFGCASDGPSLDVASRGLDTDLQAELCAVEGLSADCDLCAEWSYYADGICDDFCTSPDPDCGRLPAIGTVEVLGQHCTGVLIDSDVVLTVGACLPRASQGDRFAYSQTWRFHLGRKGEPRRTVPILEHTVLATDRAPTASTGAGPAQPHHPDIGIALLATPIDNVTPLSVATDVAAVEALARQETILMSSSPTGEQRMLRGRLGGNVVYLGRPTPNWIVAPADGELSLCESREEAILAEAGTVALVSSGDGHYTLSAVHHFFQLRSERCDLAQTFTPTSDYAADIAEAVFFLRKRSAGYTHEPSADAKWKMLERDLASTGRRWVSRTVEVAPEDIATEERTGERRLVVEIIQSADPQPHASLELYMAKGTVDLAPIRIRSNDNVRRFRRPEVFDCDHQGSLARTQRCEFSVSEPGRYQIGIIDTARLEDAPDPRAETPEVSIAAWLE
ncbi:MAG: hypothetical protein AAGF12_31235 [Myxococcota bacterium]